jgi:excisionase family DNA binding protein
MSQDVIAADRPKTLSVPEAGRKYFGLGRGASYMAAANGQLPIIRIGRRIRVPVVALERMLERVGEKHARGGS